jgi:hypothetical protein
MADCEWIVLCDYAFRGANGKMCLIGLFDTIYAPRLPALHDRAFVVASFIGEPGEAIDLTVEIIDPTGRVLVGPFTQKGVLPDAGSAQAQFELRGLELKEWGRHAIQVTPSGGSLPKQAWFSLTLLPPQKSEPPR